MTSTDDWLAALDDEHQQGFGPAMQWLVEHPGESRPGLRALVERGDDGMATRRAFDVLGRIGNADDVTLLAARLGAARGTLAADAAHGLALHRDPAALEALIAATRSADGDVVGAAASALGERRDAAARPILERLLAHGDEGVRHRAKLALEDLPG
ncbi:MAG: HEAT repeat domain-containing protein [Polyangiales bacterium]